MSKAINQHYVPQAHLRNFCYSGDKLYAFDKQASRSYPTNTRDVAAEDHFNTYRDEHGNRVSFDEAFDKIDEEVPPLVKAVLESRSLLVLTEQDKATMAEFLHVQRHRTKHARESHAAIEKVKAENQQQAADQRLDYQSSDWRARATHEFMMKMQPLLVPGYHRERVWLLLETSANAPFILSDHPVVYQAQLRSGGLLTGPVDLRHKATEVYLPLSPTLVLAIWPTWQIAIYQEVIDKFTKLSPAVAKKFGTFAPGRAKVILEAFHSGKPIIQPPEFATRINELQVLNAGRFLYSATREPFELANVMIKEMPELRGGPLNEVIELSGSEELLRKFRY